MPLMYKHLRTQMLVIQQLCCGFLFDTRAACQKSLHIVGAAHYILARVS